MPNTTTEGRTRHAVVYEQIRTDILECRLQPGERLRFDSLRKRYAVAVGPVREALMRLVPDGLVSLEEHKGFTVAEVSRDQLVEITATRRELEALAIRWSIDRGDDRWESDIVGRFHELAKRNMQGQAGELDNEWERRHRAFHASLYAACGSIWLTRYCDQLRDQTERYRRIWFRHFRTTRDVLDEHRQIMDAAIRRDSDGATYLIKKHLSQTADALLKLMAQAANVGDRQTPKDRQR
jgi:GntR family transcriptional regulator, carbon starvation induced regulator